MSQSELLHYKLYEWYKMHNMHSMNFDIWFMSYNIDAWPVIFDLYITVRNKPHTTNFIYCIFEAYFMIKSVWKNYIDCFEVNLK